MQSLFTSTNGVLKIQTFWTCIFSVIRNICHRLTSSISFVQRFSLVQCTCISAWNKHKHKISKIQSQYTYCISEKYFILGRNFRREMYFYYYMSAAILCGARHNKICIPLLHKKSRIIRIWKIICPCQSEKGLGENVYCRYLHWLSILSKL